MLSGRISEKKNIMLLVLVFIWEGTGEQCEFWVVCRRGLRFAEWEWMSVSPQALQPLGMDLEGCGFSGGPWTARCVQLAFFTCASELPLPVLFCTKGIQFAHLGPALWYKVQHGKWGSFGAVFRSMLQLWTWTHPVKIQGRSGDRAGYAQNLLVHVAGAGSV